MAPTTDTASTTAAAAMAPMSDADFMTKADEGGHNEMGLSQVVLMKNPSPTARTYATRMITDHTKAGNELVIIAKKHGVKLKGMMDAEHQAIRAALLKLSGSALEKNTWTRWYPTTRKRYPCSKAKLPTVKRPT